MIKYTHFIFMIGLLTMMSCGSSKLPQTSVNGKSYSTFQKKISKSVHLAYIDEGPKDARPIIFVHGLGSNMSAWAKNIDQLKSRFRCIAVDLPGYGTSSRGDYDYTMRFFSASIVALSNKLKLNNPVLAGHSMGGHIVLKTLIDHPDQFGTAILMAPAGIETFTEQEASWLKMVYTPAVVKNTNDDQIKMNMALNFSEMPEDAQFMIDERIHMTSDPDFDRYASMIPKCVAGMLDEPVYQNLSDISARVLILFGANDKLIPNVMLHKNLSSTSVAVDGASQIKGSELEIWENCGHMLQWECADRTNRAIQAFLDN